MGPQNKIDNTREFIPINFSVLTVSDSRSLQNDKSGDILVSKINESGHTLKKRQLVSDEIDSI